MEEIKYISIKEFIHNANIKISTFKRNYKKIPGVVRNNEGFLILSGTRYPCDLHRYKLKDSAEKRYALLKTIGEYKFISHKDLRVELMQFEQMLRDLLSAGLIQENKLSNKYGANAYDCTMDGENIIQQKKSNGLIAISKLIAECAGIFTGSIISNMCEV